MKQSTKEILGNIIYYFFISLALIASILLIKFIILPQEGDTNQPAGNIATATSSKNTPVIPTDCLITVNGRCSVVDLQSINDRLNSLDGGAENRWVCEEETISNFNTQHPDLDIFWRKDVYDSGFVPLSMPEGALVIRTIGGETTEQLGYSSCTLLPKNLWDVNTTPIN